MNNGIFLALGGNVGDVASTFSRAQEELRGQGVEVVKASPLYKTEPLGGLDQDWYLNQVIKVKTKQSPEELLQTCLLVEAELGRIRDGVHWAPRPIDIDLLFYHDVVLQSDRLSLPHPGITQRRFVLIPLADIAPQFVHPRERKRVDALLAELNTRDHLQVIPV